MKYDSTKTNKQKNVKKLRLQINPELKLHFVHKLDKILGGRGKSFIFVFTIDTWACEIQER